MSSRTSLLHSRLQAARQEKRDLIGWLIIAALTAGIIVLVGLPLTRTLPIVGVFVLGKLLDLLITVFALPQVLQSFVPGIALLLLSGWLFISNGSSLLLMGAAFASGWILHTAVCSPD